MGQGRRERPIDILLVEDNPGDVRLTEEAFKAARINNDLHTVTHGTDALDYLHKRGDYEDATTPDIILLDLNLPGLDGRAVLEEIKNAPQLKMIPVIILTSSQAEEDIEECYEAHANAYLTKPVDGDAFVALTRSIGEFWLQLVELPPVDEDE